MNTVDRAKASQVERVTSATSDEVFAVLSDGWLYSSWVVGASRIRDVDSTWPQAGSKLHHSFGVWPAVIDDVTEVLECDPPRLFRLQAKGWPLGEATVELELHPIPPHGTRIEMREAPTAGPGTLVPTPLLAPGIKLRNREALRRLTLIAENRGE